MPLARFFPFDSSAGDRATERSDDGSSGEIAVNFTFPFFNRSFDKLFVNTNGVISFLQELKQYKPQDFPLSDATALIAPFWADVDLQVGGTIWYRESLDAELLQRATQEVREYFPELRRFKARWIFVATWHEVGFYGATGDGVNRRNTFQCVLISNGDLSFVIFNYHKIQWTTGSNSGGSTAMGLGGNPAQVGFNAGDGKHYAKVEGARSNAVRNLTRTSNVGIPGKWVFRVDSASIQGHCTQRGNGSISLWPRLGSMLGGNVVNISGPCFAAGDEVRGRVEQQGRVEGELEQQQQQEEAVAAAAADSSTFPCHYVSDAMVSCVMPQVFVTGVVTVSLNINRQGWNFSGTYTYINLAAYTPVVERVNPEQWVAGRSGKVRIRWNPALLNGAANCTVRLKGFSMQNGTPRFVSLDEAETGVRNNGSHSLKLPNISSDYSAAVLQVQAEFNGSEGSPSPFAWSDVFPVVWRDASQSERWCRAWAGSAGNVTLEGALPCPCTASQAQGDTGRFQPDPACRAGSPAPSNCLYRHRAAQCMVPTEGRSNVANSQCCYGNDGELINAQQDPAAGGVAQLLHFRSQGEGGVAYFSYFLQEELPRLHCCVLSHSACPLFLARRPPTQCQGYDPPAAAQAAGDPHLVTIDGREWTFNGAGDFVLVQDQRRPHSLVVQVRAEQVPDINGTLQNATVFTHVAMVAGETSARLEVRRADNQDEAIVETLVNGVLEDLDSPITELAGMTLKRVDASNGTEFTVVLGGTGMSILIRATRDLLNIMVMVGSETLKGQLEGLLGNYNGNPKDDFRSRDGRLLPSNATMRELHFDFGMTWAVNSSESLLAGGQELTPPPITPPFLDELPHPEGGGEVCGSNLQCLYDLAVTKNRDIAVSTRSFTEFVQKRREGVKPVVRCPFLPDSVQNGNLTVEGTTNGSRARVQCQEGYVIRDRTQDDSAELVCRADGSWQPPAPPRCIKPTEPDNENSWIVPAYIAGGVGGGALVLIVLVLVIVFACRHRRKKIHDGGRDEIELPNIFPPSDIPKPVFENPSFLHSLQRLSESGPFRIPRPTFVDPSIYKEYF